MSRNPDETEPAQPGYLHRRLMIATMTLLCITHLGVAVTFGATPGEVLRQELADIRGRIGKLEQLDNAHRADSVLSARRAEAVRALVHDVLADADTRASLLDLSVQCGYNHGFRIADDENFLMKIWALFQVRHVYNRVRDDEDRDEVAAGFQLRRTWLGLSGHVVTPKLRYTLLTTFSRSDESMGVEIARFDYDLTDEWSIGAGQCKAPFLREWLISSRYQQAADRSYVFNMFTHLYTQGIFLNYQGPDVSVQFSINDGAHSWKTDFYDDRTDVGLTLRGQWKVLGEWSQFSAFTSSPGDDLGLMLGAAVDYERGQRGEPSDYADLFKYTADLTFKGDGWNIFGAFVGQHVTKNSVPGSLTGAALSTLARRAVDQFGLMLQGGIYVIPEKLELFARYEWLTLDDALFNARTGVTTNIADDDIQLVTVGGVWYLHGKVTKFIVDVIYAMDPLPLGDSGAGLRASTRGDQITLRTQFQLSF